MTSKKRYKLESELLSVGASRDEARVLAGHAMALAALRGHEAGALPPLPDYSRRGARTWLGVGFAGSLALVIGLVAVAQIVLPGNLLYPVKIWGENVAVAVHPDWRGEMMMRRAAEVDSLVAAHQSPRLVVATLASYDDDARKYTGGDAADYSYCKARLRQAESMASGSERTAIAAALAGAQS